MEFTRAAVPSASWGIYRAVFRFCKSVEMPCGDEAVHTTKRGSLLGLMQVSLLLDLKGYSESPRINCEFPTDLASGPRLELN